MALRRLLRVPLSVAAGAVALGACSSGFSAQELARAPAWFRDAQKEIGGTDYPSLTDVPAAPAAPGEAERWARIEQELRAASAGIAASPRAQPAPTVDDDAEAFDRAAREAIDRARPGAAATAAEPARPQ